MTKKVVPPTHIDAVPHAGRLFLDEDDLAALEAEDELLNGLAVEWQRTGKGPIHEHMGLTLEQYAAWVERTRVPSRTDLQKRARAEG